MASEFFDDIMKIAEDRKFGEYAALNNEETKGYIAQLVEFLEVIHKATKILEGDNLPTIAMVVPTVLNTVAQLETPEVIK